MSDALTPSQAIIAAANTPEAVNDAKGRKIEVLLVTGSRLSKLMRVCGPNADSGAWFPLTQARAALRSIDGMPCAPFPATMDQIDAMWDAIDDTAVMAVLEFNKAKEAAATPEAIKNS